MEGLKENEKNVDKGNQPDIKSEDNAIEMSNDLDGKIHDLEKNGRQRTFCLELEEWWKMAL